MKRLISQRAIAFLLFSLFLPGAETRLFAQSTAFVYQGRLQDGGANAIGSYDFQFTLWDSLSGGTQQPQSSPAIVTKSGVAVANGIFTVQLDFGASAFPGADRYLEISVRSAGGGTFVLLSPRQPITSTPYAIRALDTTAADSLSSACNSCVQSTHINFVAAEKVSGVVASAANATNSSQLGGIPAINFVLTSDSRLTDSRVPSPGSSNYIQNTTIGQASSSFNVSGNSNVGGTLVAGTQGIPLLFNNPPPNPKLIVFGNSVLVGNALFNTNGTNGVRLTPANDMDIGVLNVTNAANTVNWLAVGSNGQIIMNGIGNVGIGTPSPSFKLQVTGETRINTLSIDNFVSNSGGPPMCANTSTNRVGLCSSSLRYKTNVRTLLSGLDVINKLRPISFDWKEDGASDIGLAAEEVNKVEPLLTYRNKRGEVEGVRYNQLSAVFINAFKEQQAQIEKQQEQINQLIKQLRQLRTSPRRNRR